MTMRSTLNEYLARVKMRESRSVLVEGREDRETVMHVVFRLGTSRRRVTVDAACDIDVSGPAGGVRGRAEFVYRQASQDGLMLGVLVDREFREFELEGPPRDRLGRHRIEGDLLVWTRGHSMENYFLDVESVRAATQQVHANIVVPGMLDQLEQVWSSAMPWVAALSVGLAVESSISRAGELIEIEDWSIRGDGTMALALEPVQTRLIERGCDGARAERIVAATRNTWASTFRDDPAFSRWIAHGHLASNGVWTAVASLALTHGVAAADAKRIAFGHREERRRALSFRWSERCRDDPAASPVDLWAWMRA